MFADRFLKALNQTKNEKDEDKTLQAAITKIQKQKRLSSKEFLAGWDTIHKEGPKTAYQNPNAWRRVGDVT